ncbi:MAG: hypothetical protein U0575_13390 [Phycisphaerales bacterium]
MRYQVISVPAHGDAAAIDELNGFLGSHRVTRIERRLIEDGEQSYWTFCIGYVPTGDGESAPASKRGRGTPMRW